jgi:cytochrome c553
MKATSPLLAVVLAALTLATVYDAATLALANPVQAAQAAQPATGGPPPAPKTYPVPTNLKVLPKELTGEQVHQIMEQWEAALGAHCSTCHTADPTNIGPNGKPRLNFADDSRPEKSTARMMFKMTQEINMNYISMIESSGAPVTCGTCHRGHLGPEPFAPAAKEKPPAAPSIPVIPTK